MCSFVSTEACIKEPDVIHFLHVGTGYAGNDDEESSTSDSESGTEGDVEADGSVTRADRWLNEVSYNSTAVHSMRLYLNLGQELNTFYESILILVEDAHRRCKETLLVYLPKRRRLFLRISEVWSPAVDMVERRQVPLDKVEAAITETLVQLSREKMTKNQGHRSSIMNRSRTRPPVLGNGSLPPYTTNKPDALRGRVVESLHVKERMLTEVRETGKSSWRDSFTIITIDGFMHIFVPTDGNNENNSESRVRFSKVIEWARDLEENYRPPLASLCLNQCQWTRDSENKQVDFLAQGQSRSSISIRFRDISEMNRFVVAAADNPDVL
jgi:hypothetical protein